MFAFFVKEYVLLHSSFHVLSQKHLLLIYKIVMSVVSGV